MEQLPGDHLKHDVEKNLIEKCEDIKALQSIIGQLAVELSDWRQDMRNLVSGYNDYRVTAFEQALKDRHLSWCTKCQATKAIDSYELLLTEGVERVSFDYEEGDISYRPFSELHHLCQECSAQAHAKDGWLGDFGHGYHASYFAYRIEEQPDGFYADKNGQLVKIGKETDGLPEPTNTLVDRHLTEWGYPPRISIDHEGNAENLEG
jgi:hypothetical protein